MSTRWLVNFVQLLLVLAMTVSLAPSVLAAPIDEQEYFDTANTTSDWSSWQPTDANGNPSSNPGTNGWLMTRQTTTGINGSTLTPSAGTGPTSLDSGTGFLFLEASGTGPFTRYFTRNAGFDAGANQANVSFKFSANGANITSLKFQVNSGSGWVTEWQQLGADGNGGSWTGVDIHLFSGTVSINGGGAVSTTTYGGSGNSYTSGTLQMRFEFVSNSFAGDTAIDTLRVYGPDACDPAGTLAIASGQSLYGNPIDLTTITTTSGATNLNFLVGAGGTTFAQFDDFGSGSGSMGNWVGTDTNTAGSSNWTLDSNTTPSANVGPSSGEGGSGFYVYTEASQGAYPETYWLTSNSLDNTTYALGLDFFYNKNHNGVTTCQLHVDASSDNGQTWDNLSLWNTSADSGDVWNQQTLDLSAIAPTGSGPHADKIKVRFRTVATQYQCDVGIDSVSISGAARSAPPFSGNASQAQTVNTSGWIDGKSYMLTLSGDDTLCGTPLPSVSESFTYYACGDTNGTSVTLASPSAGATLIGDVDVSAVSVNGVAEQYRYDGGPWIAITTPWDTAASYPQSVNAPVTGVLLEVRVKDDECPNLYFYDSVTVDVDNTCVDLSPSDITVPPGSSISGNVVDLTTLYTATGNVGGLSYYIDGVSVSSPWDSSAVGTSSPEVVKFEVYGTDPDCGQPTIYGYGFVTVDNTCVVNAPTFTFDRSKKYIEAGGVANYAVTVYNHDSPACAAETFTLSAAGDSHAAISSSVGAPATQTVAAGQSKVFTLQVAVPVGTPDWDENVTTVHVTATGHTDPADQNVTTTVYKANNLLHNSITTGSDKHGGLWGTSQPGSKYGRFNCGTCHQRGSNNVKQIRETLGAAPDTSNGDFPGSGMPIALADVRDGSAGFGDDARADQSQSDMICEVCHTYDSLKVNGVNKHAYNMAAPGDQDHFNRTNCVECHEHKTGFKATCDVCHGNGAIGAIWPDSLPADGAAYIYADRSGAHENHIEHIGNYLASGNKRDGSLTTLEHKNSTCVFCHPNPGGSNPDGAMHVINTSASPADTADLYQDGHNQSSHFRFLDGSEDTDGFYDPTIQRCSNIDCHSNGQFTWSWYGDQIAPGVIVDLNAQPGTEIGSVRLTWSAPGNDGATAGKAYGYEVRYSTSAISSEAGWAAATVAGGPPSTKWPGFAQEMTVNGLQPGTVYHFAIKAFDEVGNWSSISTPNPSVAATDDTTAPSFYGLEEASPAFTDGVVNLAWSAASDISSPIIYRVWWSDTSTPIDYATAPNATTTALTYQVAGLTNGLNYNFAVRAEDSKGNRDSNMVQKEAIPQMPNEVEWMGAMYRALNSSAHACNTQLTYAAGSAPYTGDLTTGPYSCAQSDSTRLNDVTGTGVTMRWLVPDADKYSAPTNVQGSNFRIYIRERDEVAAGQGLRFRLGYTLDGSSFTWLGTVDQTVPGGHRGNFNIGLAGINDTVPAGGRLAFEIEKIAPNTASRLEMRYASERFQSFLTVFEQQVNLRPAAFSVTTPNPGSPAAKVTLSWTAAVDPEGDPVSYGVYASLDGGTSYPIVIAENLATTSTLWDTQADGIGMLAPQGNVRVKVRASDGLNHNEGGTWYDHREALSNTFTVDNTSDITAPAPILDLVAEHRPKAGSVYLYWTATGDDGRVGLASVYDIRYSVSPIDAANFATANQVSGEPVPSAPGTHQGFEVLGLIPEQLYFFAIKAADEAGNWSSMSNVPSSRGGPECGVCHGTPPDQPARAGTHERHGYTQVDCAKCHGSEAVSFTNNHADGQNKVAFNNPRFGFPNKAFPAVTETATQVTYRAGGTGAGVILYDDSTGGGGYNDIEPGGDNIDNGSCSGFNASGVTGCHGAAGSDPDGAGPLPLYPAPVWGDANSVSCAMCHGDQSRPDADPYGRPFEDPTHDTTYAGNVEIYKAAPPIDLLGQVDSHAVGQHLRHLNFSYRFTGNSCTLCHKNHEHADGTVDVRFDASVAGHGAIWIPGSGGNPGTCSGTSEIRCHGNNVTDPRWETRITEPNGPRRVECNQCHGFDGKTYDIANNLSAIPHVKDGGTVRHCTHCHVEGHPREGNSIADISNANPAVVSTPNHNLHDGDTVLLSVHGMAELNHWYGTITVIDNNSFSLNGVDSSGFGTFDKGYWKLTYPAKTISAISRANPAVVTSAGHGLSTGDNVLMMVSGMLELDHYDGPVTVLSANTFSLDGIDSTGYGAFSAGDWIKVDGAILLPNYSISGIEYSSGGIHLKRVVNGRTHLNNGERIDTEAETCWGCHEDNGISEWGTNSKALTGNSSYDYGTLDKTSWYGAVWNSSNFSYKTGTIQSTHSVNPDVTGPGADTSDKIRCSYCHDVHDMNRALGDHASGAPYLRGTWKGNPYNEDGAPGRYDADGVNSAVFDWYDAQADFGAVPRGSAISKMGGFWIDQNSNYPTASWTLASSAGLCTMCHGTDVNNMNKFGTASSDWVGSNGHSNAAVGGSGMFKANIYNPNLRNEGGPGGGTLAWNAPGMGYQSTPLQTAEEMFGLRNNDGSSTNPATLNNSTATNGRGVVPYIWSTTEARSRYAFGEFTWAVDRSIGTTSADAELQYHRFSCSKCHNPHASRLPRLMITNCLDVRHNSWDDVFADDGDWAGGNATWRDTAAMPYNGTDTWNGKRYDQQLSYATSAQNCHRYVNIAGDASPEESGWNQVTPWRE